MSDPLRIYPNPELRERVNYIGNGYVPPMHQLRLAVETMRARKGVAIASNQLGIPWRFFVMEGPRCPVAIINPVLDLLGPFKAVSEGCLSLPEQFAMVMRSERVKVNGVRVPIEGLEAHWESIMDEVWEGLDAQIVQHETDHLNGKLFIDYLKSAERSRIKGNLSKLKRSKKL